MKINELRVVNPVYVENTWSIKHPSEKKCKWINNYINEINEINQRNKSKEWLR